MIFPEIIIDQDQALGLEHFKEMDYYAVNNYKLPIELMMENAGLNLATLVASFSKSGQNICIGIGNGNNGGGGLVAARRLAAWGYNVFLDLMTDITKELPAIQLKRALKFGASLKNINTYDVWVDAYLGFSQRLPLSDNLLKTIVAANNSSAVKISLDIPTGFLGADSSNYFCPDKVLTLAAPKRILFELDKEAEIYIADLGIPKEVYLKFGVDILPFYTNSIIKQKR